MKFNTLSPSANTSLDSNAILLYLCVNTGEFESIAIKNRVELIARYSIALRTIAYAIFLIYTYFFNALSVLNARSLLFVLKWNWLGFRNWFGIRIRSACCRKRKLTIYHELPAQATHI